jgi:hypothetical protein
MPETQIIFFQDDRGEVLVLNWLKKLIKQDRKGYANCIARIEQLAEYGFELQQFDIKRATRMVKLSRCKKRR